MAGLVAGRAGTGATGNRPDPNGAFQRAINRGASGIYTGPNYTPPPPPRPAAAPAAAPRPQQSYAPQPQSYGGGGGYMPSMPSYQSPSYAPPPMFSQGPAPTKNSEPVDMAMDGLSGAIKDMSGPAPGWADDPALMETAGELGATLPKNAMRALSQMTRGIY